MPARQTSFTMRPLLLCLCAALTLSSCASRQPKQEAAFKPDTPFSKVVRGEGDAVCWSVRRAFLSQGYMLDRGGDSAIMSGTKDTQVDEKTNVTLRLQTTCVDNRDGTSTVFASAAEETSKMQTNRNSVSAGVSNDGTHLRPGVRVRVPQAVLRACTQYMHLAQMLVAIEGAIHKISPLTNMVSRRRKE